MIPIASGVRVWIATGYTDMRRADDFHMFLDFGHVIPPYAYWSPASSPCGQHPRRVRLFLVGEWAWACVFSALILMTLKVVFLGQTASP
jgi:hypothetical protein